MSGMTISMGCGCNGACQCVQMQLLRDPSDSLREALERKGGKLITREGTEFLVIPYDVIKQAVSESRSGEDVVDGLGSREVDFTEAVDRMVREAIQESVAEHRDTVVHMDLDGGSISAPANSVRAKLTAIARRIAPVIIGGAVVLGVDYAMSYLRSYGVSDDIAKTIKDAVKEALATPNPDLV